MITPARFAEGMTFDQYVAYTATAENLKREGSQGPRKDWSGFLRKAYEAARLSEAQEQAWKWLAAQPGGPARVLMISEEWSSDCRRDAPIVARVADVAGLELRIFPRDGQRCSRAPAPSPEESPNADLMSQFLNHKNGQTWQSIPVAAFFTRRMEPLYHYIEYPAIYHKDRVVGSLRAPRAGETKEQGQERGNREFMDLQGSAFFRVWAGAGVDEMLSMLHERI
ncbi:MAG: thioredoxin family protein, partial [Candidatus Rokuibacteriota bacterium]